MEAIARIKNKLERLKTEDKNLKIFGAGSHNYELNSVLSGEEVERFENLYNIVLPDEYKTYVLNLGNGGAGPFYGIQKLSDTIYGDLDYKNEGYKLNPSLPFLFTESWNLDPEDFDDDETFENEYFDSKYSNGLLRLCNYGCGVSINLVVNGEDYGKMWTDDRGSDGGIYPSIELKNQERLSFLKWYDLWLDNSLEELKKL